MGQLRNADGKPHNLLVEEGMMRFEMQFLGEIIISKPWQKYLESVILKLKKSH
jgi:hypothetical protein